MNRFKSSHSSLPDQTREISSPVAGGASQQDVTWKYGDSSPIRRSKVAKQSELPTQDTPVRIIKRHASSPLPESSSRALQHSRKLKTLVEFEQLSDDDDSLHFSPDFDITEDELIKVIEDAEKMARHERLVSLTSPALPEPMRPLKPKRQILEELPIPLYATRRMSEPDLPKDVPQTQVTPPNSKESASSNEDFLVDFDNSYEHAILSSIPIELLSSKAESTQVDPELKLSQIVTQQAASTLKPIKSSSEKKFFKHRINPVLQDIPLNMTQKLQIAENRREALKRLEEYNKRRQNQQKKH